MANRSERTRNNVKAGVFVSAGIVLMLVVAMILGDAGRLLTPRTRYILRFPLAAGVEGLSTGSPVRVGGLERGRVLSVVPESDGDLVKAMLVDFELDRDIALFNDADADRIAPLLGGTAAINFSDVGDPAKGTRLGAGDVLDIRDTPGGAMRRLLGDEGAARLASIMRNLDETLASARADYARVVTPVLDKIDAAVTDARDLVASVRRDYPGWSEKIGSTLGNVDTASAKLDPLLDDGRTMIADIRGTVGDARAILTDNRTRIDELIENVRVASGDIRAISERTKNEIVSRVVALLDQGSRGLDAFTSVAQRLRQEIDAAGPQLDRILADARLTSQQLKLTSIEVRRAPWRLLYRPSDKELDNELLYDAARSFALAAGELESTSQSLDRVLTRDGDLLRTQPEQAERIRSLLNDSLQRFEAAQQRLFTILVDDAKKKE
ncbi:MAG: hypothetical protein U0575_05560 [Phycisphaerales bacterium]